MGAGRAILFAAFEPSGDALAAKLAAELRRRDVEWSVHALGGPALRRAGAELIEETTGGAAMGLSVLGHAAEHRRRLHRLTAWLAEHPIAAVVPVDSPAANWSICSLVRKHQPAAKVIHLVCPQVWAWATWRVRRLRRLSDHVLCILPFEPAWLARYGVAATFVGHPLFDDTDLQSLGRDGSGLRLAMLPGSRTSEIDANWPTMLQVFETLQKQHPHLRGIAAAANSQIAARLQASLCVLDDPRICIEDDADQVLLTSDAALVVSGTATLHAAARRCPMVVFYNVSRPAWHLFGRWVIKTRTFSLPNILAESLDLRGRVPEFVPHFRQVAPLVTAMDRALCDSAERQQQADLFTAIAARFADRPFATSAADVVQGAIGP